MRMMNKISLTQGKLTIVDDEDYDWLNQWKWRAVNSNGSKRNCVPCWYAMRSDKRKKSIYMHREIAKKMSYGMAEWESLFYYIRIDHINGRGLDNRRSNLRMATPCQNARNQAKRLGTLSKFKGVIWHNQSQKWHARIFLPGNKAIGLGFYNEESAAALAYDNAAKKYFGEFARLNFSRQMEHE